MGITDYIGGRGEAIAYARLARVCRTDSDMPYFWPHYLGEKCQTFDFLVELVDAGDKTPFFFVQVKATRKEFTRSQMPPRLRVEVSENDVRRGRARRRGKGLCNLNPRDHVPGNFVHHNRPRVDL